MLKKNKDDINKKDDIVTQENNEPDKNLEVDDLLSQYDKDTSRLRKPVGMLATVITVIAILMSLFHLYTAARGTLLAMR